MAMTKRDKEWLSSLGVSLRVIAENLEGRPTPIYAGLGAPTELRKIAEALEKAGLGQL